MKTYNFGDIMISVILTVQNNEKNLHICLNSILKQTFSDFEVICIDDASSDSSLEILEYFTMKDQRIKLVKNKFRKGTEYSRNIGLNNAQKKYIIFLNGSDWIDFNTFEILVGIAEKNKLDVLMFKSDINKNYLEKEMNIDFMENFESKIFTHIDLNHKLFKIPSTSLNKLYSKKFLDENKIKFENNQYSDISFFFKVMTNAKRISFLSKELCNTKTEYKPFFSTLEDNIFTDINMIFKFFDVFHENTQLYLFYKKFLLQYIFEEILNNKYEQINYKYQNKVFFQIQSIYKKFIINYNMYSDLVENISPKVLSKFEFYKIAESLKNKKPKVSVIMPVYNVNNYLKTCLESVINQTLTDIEIICINDGSTDNSLEILMQYAKYDNIKIINQKNSGAGSARNLGLEYANGEYIFFLDSDDVILRGTLESLYNNAVSNDSDLVLSKIARFNDFEFNYSIPGFPLDELFDDVDFNNFTFNYTQIKSYVLNTSFAPWIKLYKNDFLRKYDDLKFPIGIMFEDVIFHVKCLLRSQRMSFVPKYFYQYRVSNNNSQMHNISHKDIFTVCDNVEEFLCEEEYYEEFELEFIMFKIRQLSQYISVDSDEYYKSVQSEFKSMKIKDYIGLLPDDLRNIYLDIINLAKNDGV